MKKLIKINIMVMMIFVLSCEADDPLSFYGGTELVDLVESAWASFRDGDYDVSLATFQEAKDIADEQTGTDTLLIHSTYGSIHTGIGWCNLRLLNADIARDNFIISQGYVLYSFGTSVGLMASYFELGNEIPIDTAQINLAIEIGHWIFSSGMPEEFENDVTINVNDVKLLMAKSYYAKGDLSDNSDEGSGALYWILQLEPGYVYLNGDPLTWNLYNYGMQDFDSFDEIILMILRVLESEVFPA
tara:strand:+ start:231 stop:962 length:732 start_codon:yes stop_codon:yes gene_type:complete